MQDRKREPKYLNGLEPWAAFTLQEIRKLPESGPESEYLRPGEYGENKGSALAEWTRRDLFDEMEV